MKATDKVLEVRFYGSQNKYTYLADVGKVPDWVRSGDYVLVEVPGGDSSEPDFRVVKFLGFTDAKTLRPDIKYKYIKGFIPRELVK